jgi:hypothetical protein
MTDTFTGLFDTKKYGLNVLAALAYFAGGLIGWLLWGVWNLFGSLIRYGQLQFPISLRVLGLVAVTSVIGAVVVVGLAHVLNSDILLPIVAGLAMVAWGLVARSVNILPLGTLSRSLQVWRVAADFLWTAVPLAGAIIFYRSLGRRPLAFIVGFASGSLLVQLVTTVVFQRISVAGLIVDTAGGALMGLLFFAAMASHLKWEAAAAIGGEFGTRPVGLVVMGWLVSLFVPGLGHLVLGYLKDGFRTLGMAVGAFAVAVVLSLVGVQKQWAILPLFFVWLFALRDLWGRRAGGSREVAALRRALREGSPQEMLQAIRPCSRRSRAPSCTGMPRSARRPSKPWPVSDRPPSPRCCLTWQARSGASASGPSRPYAGSATPLRGRL